MWVRRLCVGVLGLVLSALPLAAQRPGTFEIGIFGQATKFDESLNLNSAWGAGGRLGVFVLPGLAIEGDVANARPLVKAGSPLLPTDDDRLSYAPLYLRLAYNMMVGWRGGVILGAGVVRSDYGTPYALGANGLLGFRVGLTDRLQVRLDGLVDYMGKSEPEKTTNLTARFGLSFMPGPSKRTVVDEITRPGDIDQDGVLDNIDECKDTPAGVRVDMRGCTVPVDSDGDGVVDAADRCPNTPAGTSVDANGCPQAAAPMDSDQDGVADAADRCPGTAPGNAVDANGCVVVADADADGVPDSADRCANTPAGDKVDANGCSLPKDSDNDGVMDNNDRCANTPAGTTVDATGCPADSDNDGVADAADRCPNTASGFTVDANGCPASIREGVTTVELRGVNFETGSARLTAESNATLDAVANILTSTGIKVEVAGHTDNTGSVRTNDNLSQSRAMAVRSYLIGKGVPAAQIIARGYGSKQPIGDNATAEGRAQNRRVELKKL